MESVLIISIFGIEWNDERKYILDENWWAHSVAIPWGWMMKIFMAGGTGFVGTYLIGALIRLGHEVTLLVRPSTDQGPFVRGARIVMGDPSVKGDWQEACAGHEAVINLAGASIFRLWTAGARKEILESRVRSTENIVEALGNGRKTGTVLLNASGVGYYGYRGDDIVDEGSGPGDTFLAGVAGTWETAALSAKESGVRVVLCRLGIVLGRGGGAFQRMLPLAAHHLGAPWGDGTQWFPWVHEADAAGIVAFLLDHGDIDGPVNLTSPNPVTNREMMKVLNKVLGKKPFIPSVPGWVLRSILAEFSNVFLRGQRAVPGVVTKNGFVFQFPDFRQAVTALIRP